MHRSRRGSRAVLQKAVEVFNIFFEEVPGVTERVLDVVVKTLQVLEVV